MQKMKIVVACGGFSEENEVSKISSAEISRALQEKGHSVRVMDPADYTSYQEFISRIREQDPDIVFNGMHGSEGENGLIQALFELNGLAYTGSGVRASALAMDKYISGLLAESLGMTVPARRRLARGRLPRFEPDFPDLPLVVKPNDSGSSVGITIVTEPAQIKPALAEAALYSPFLLLEEFIPG
ncbi:MAG: D-alanine--D-alanine ligase, partial [Candidatus Cloacimonetes bacterium]|nr:D-alanine--D-alanine ligase [Candidatus Cloacimonadota bacterium]